MQSITTLPRILFFLIIKIAVLIMLGINVRNKARLPTHGPAIIVANHNSHLDALVLISLFPLHKISHIHPVAAADYFLKNRIIAWFSSKIIGIISIARGKASKSYDALKPCADALDRGDIIILFPEGTRGEPEQMQQFKKGIAFLAERYPEVPITPIFIHGLGKALPKGECILVPFFCDIFVGEKLKFNDDRNSFMDILNKNFLLLANEANVTLWE